MRLPGAVGKIETKPSHKEMKPSQNPLMIPLPCPPPTVPPPRGYDAMNARAKHPPNTQALTSATDKTPQRTPASHTQKI